MDNSFSSTDFSIGLCLAISSCIFIGTFELLHFFKETLAYSSAFKYRQDLVLSSRKKDCNEFLVQVEPEHLQVVLGT